MNIIHNGNPLPEPGWVYETRALLIYKCIRSPWVLSSSFGRFLTLLLKLRPAGVWAAKQFSPQNELFLRKMTMGSFWLENLGPAHGLKPHFPHSTHESVWKVWPKFGWSYCGKNSSTSWWFLRGFIPWVFSHPFGVTDFESRSEVASAYCFSCSFVFHLCSCLGPGLRCIGD